MKVPIYVLIDYDDAAVHDEGVDGYRPSSFTYVILSRFSCILMTLLTFSDHSNYSSFVFK